MIGSVGFPEMVVLFVLALLVFGPRKLPELGRTIGKTLAAFRRASNEFKETLEREVAVEEASAQSRPRPATPAMALPPPDAPAEQARPAVAESSVVAPQETEPAASAPEAEPEASK